ncbi:uncharacterized protein L3040_008534 [Drepanopeziza brunnea f. sp. 'multigermtubi']|uniref:uncharacterized protein n=1 Tax=Drepanopeziza brunnea f. sp. 'multigermtubi' TaxID=698441 RepID=UPI0023982646|nr:hypothetical protein L3040_008534 [Drepanopeziza brunnea f. sp. 'multigermtubi']
MSATSRGLRSFVSREVSVCSRCLFSTSSSVLSGHNRWSKIKHDKGAVDAKKNVQRSIFSREIALASKLYGGDPNMNPRLAAILVNAKKAGFPKASMESAIARGQGKSATGAALENFTLEVIVPPTVAMIIETETDNKARTMMDLRHLVKVHGGTVTPTTYLFQKRGRVAFSADDGKTSVDDVLDDAIEAGAEDVEADDDGGIVVWTEPNRTTAAANALHKSHGLKVESADIIWDANEDTKVPLDGEHMDAVKGLSALLDALQDNPNVQGVYANAAQGSLTDEVWEELVGKLDA